MRKKVLILASILLVNTGFYAQSAKLKRADNYYDKIAYAEAAELYAELLDSEVDSPTLKAKLADCYYEMGNTEKAAEYYAQIVETPEAKPEHMYKYASSLRENGNYQKSNEWMDKFNARNQTDSRATMFEENPDYVSDIKSQDNYFSIQHLQVNTKNDEFGGYPVGDQIFFISNRRAPLFVRNSHTFDGDRFLDLYFADVNKENNELENVTYQSRATNTRYHEGPMCVSQDGKTIYFTRNNIARGKNKKGEDGIQNLKLYRAFMNANDDWDEEEELVFNSKDYSTGHPTLSPDGNWLYFASDMPGGKGGADIWRVLVSEDGSLGTPENLGAEINTEGQEMFPWFATDGTLMFASDGHLGLGGLDVFAALTNEDYSVKKVLNAGEPINSIKDDFALTLDTEKGVGYFSSNRETGSGGDDIYSIKMLKPFKINLQLKGVVVKKGTKDILPGVLVNLKDTEGNVVASTIADENGGYTFDLEPEQEYVVEGSKEDYFEDRVAISTVNLPDGTEILDLDLDLEKDPGLALYTLIKNTKNLEPIDGVDLKIVDNMTGEEFLTTFTGETGDALKGITGKKIGERISYNIYLQKEGYFSKMVTFNHKIEKLGVINVHEFLPGGLFMDKEVAELVKINSINFDLNKYNIRPDAEVELNKIVEAMNKYPGMTVELGSHTDCRASKAYNEKLSDRRAKASAAYIASKITDPDRIYGKGYGESRILNGCECEGRVKSDCSEKEHEKNRRTEFRVIKTGAEDLKVINTSSNSFD